MNSFRSGLPDTFSARDSPAGSVTSVKIGPAALAGWSARATAARCETAARPIEPPSSRRNPRREDACLRALVTRAVRRCSSGAARYGPPLLVELVGLAFEALEHLERLLALVRPPEATVYAAQHVVVRRGARVEGDRAVQRANRLVQPALAFFVQGGRLLVHRHGAGVVPERLEGEPLRVDGFEVGRIQAQRPVERVAR